MENSSTAIPPLNTTEVSTIATLRRSRLPRGGLHISERRLVLVIVDLLIVNGALVIAQVARGRIPASPGQVWDRLPWFIVLSVLWMLIGLLFDVYNLFVAASRIRSILGAGSTAVLTCIVYILIPRITPSLPVRRVDLLPFPLIAILGIAAWRLAYATIIVQPAFRQKLIFSAYQRKTLPLCNLSQI